MENKPIGRSEKGHIIYEAKCKICQKYFNAKKNNTLCCSNACRSLKMQIKRREYFKNFYN
jgi:hypothetical protein